MADLTDLLYADEPTAQEKMAALSAALRKQKAMGMLGQLTGDSVLGNFGGGLVKDASHQQDQLQAIPQGRASLLLEKLQAAKAQRESDAAQSPQAGVAYRALLTKFGATVPENTPNSVLEHILPTAEKGYGVDQNAAARRDAAAQNAELRKAMMLQQQNRFDVTTGLKDDQFKAKRLKELTEAIDPFMRRGGLQNYTQGINRAQKLDALLVDPATGQPKKLLTPQDMLETTIALQQLVAAGHASQNEVEQLAPKSIGSDVARGLQYFTGKPWDSGQQAWALRMLHTAAREAQVNRDSIVQALKQRLPQFVDIRSKHGADYESILKGAGINPAAFNEQGLPIDGMEIGLGTNPMVGGPGAQSHTAPTGRPRRTVNGETREWDGKAWVPVAH